MPLRAEAPIGAPCWVDIMTSDPAKTQAFYTELFGYVEQRVTRAESRKRRSPPRGGLRAGEG